MLADGIFLAAVGVVQLVLEHLTAACTHLLLGTANLVFWSAFPAFDMVTPGVALLGVSG